LRKLRGSWIWKSCGFSSRWDLNVDLKGGLLIWYEKSLSPWTACQ
jgi:hypothetical protein